MMLVNSYSVRVVEHVNKKFTYARVTQITMFKFFVVILKISKDIFSTMTLDYWNNYDSFGSHMPNMNCEIIVCSASVELIQ